jgi:hypothetical protein
LNGQELSKSSFSIPFADLRKPGIVQFVMRPGAASTARESTGVFSRLMGLIRQPQGIDDGKSSRSTEATVVQESLYVPKDSSSTQGGQQWKAAAEESAIEIARLQQKLTESDGKRYILARPLLPGLFVASA